MKVIAEILVGVVLLAALPFAVFARTKPEGEQGQQNAGTAQEAFRSSARRYRLDIPKKSDRIPRSTIEERVDQFLEAYEPVYDSEDPSDGYFAGWMKVKGSDEELLSNLDRLQLLGEGYSFLAGVKLAEPGWKPQLVERKIAEVRAGVQKALLAEQDAAPQIRPIWRVGG